MTLNILIVDDNREAAELFQELLEMQDYTVRCAFNGAQALELARAEPALTIESPFLRASRAFVPMLIRMGAVDRARAADPASARPSTVAERFSCEDLVHCFRLRYGGMLLRALEVESAAGTASAPLRRLSEEAGVLHATWQADAAADDRAEVIPIASLVGVQYGAVLAAAAHLAGVGRATDPAPAAPPVEGSR